MFLICFMSNLNIADRIVHQEAEIKAKLALYHIETLAHVSQVHLLVSYSKQSVKRVRLVSVQKK